MKKIIRFLFPALFLAVIASCSDKPRNDYYPEDMMVDIATYVSSSDNGSVFTLRKDGDSPLVTLTSTRVINENMFKPVTRVLIQYVPESGIAYKSGPMELYSVQAVNSTLKEGTAADYTDWFSDPFSMGGLWRTGNYINLWANIDVEQRPETFELVLDTKTINDECPEYHVIFRTDGVDGRRHVIYGSYDISKVWSLQTCSSIRVYYPDSHGTTSLVFYKNSTPIVPAE